MQLLQNSPLKSSNFQEQSDRFSFQSSELDTPNPSLARVGCSSPFGSETHSFAGEAGGGIIYISDEGIDTLVLYVRVYCIIPVHFQGITFQGKPITDTDHFTKSMHAQSCICVPV
jgi:hypothetical protein